MKRVVLAGLLLACKSEQRELPAAANQPLGIVAEIRSKATLVPGTWRFALRTEHSWYESARGALAAEPGLGAAIAREVDALGGVVDVFLGVTPIVVGGEDHHEVHVRVTPDRVPIELDGLATKIETTRAGREVWAYTHHLTKHGAVDGRPMPQLERLAPVPESASPVSRKICQTPQVQDVAASDRLVHVLVVECNEDAPLRVLTYDGDKPTELRLPSRRALGIAFEKLVVARDGTASIVAVRDRKLAIVRSDGTLATFGPANRVFAAVLSVDGAVWAFLDDAGKPAITRDGKLVELDGRTASALAYDDKLGVVVLATGINAMWLYAERPGTPITITR